jgi:hypothetical protein
MEALNKWPLTRAIGRGACSNMPRLRQDCQIAFNCDPPFASNNDPVSVRHDGAETGGAEPRIAEQSRSWRAAGGEREVMRGS